MPLASSLFSCASFLPRSLASVYRPRQYPQWRPTPSGRPHQALASLNEPFVSEPLAGGSVNEAFKTIESVYFYVPLVEPERKLLNVTVKMLRAGVMIDAMKTAFQDRKDALSAVRGDAFASVAFAVIDRFVLVARQAAINRRLVSVNNRAGFNKGGDSALHSIRRYALDCSGQRSAPAFTQSKDRCLATCTALTTRLFTGLLVSLQPT